MGGKRTIKGNANRLVYRIVRDDGVVPYVGMGSVIRMKRHMQIVAHVVAGTFCTHVQNIHRRMGEQIRHGRRFTIEIVKDGLTRAEAFALEASLIAEIGCETDGTGPLWNLSKGARWRIER
jgi:hypothetical protein